MSVADCWQVGKRSTLYPPKELIKKLGLEEGGKVVFSVEGDRLIVEKVKDPWMLALHSANGLKPL